MSETALTLNEKLIEEVKKYPFLFNKKERDYKNTVKKTRVWVEIATKLLLPAEDCSKKWKSLRDRYTRELKKLSELNDTGTESQQLEIHNWDLFDSLSFLRDHCEPNKKTVTNYTQPTSSSATQVSNDQSSCASECSSEHIIYIQEEDQSEGFDSRPGTSSSGHSSGTSNQSCQEATPSRKAQKRKSLEDVNAQFMEAATSFKEMCSNSILSKKLPTEDELFGQRVVAFIGAIADEEDKNNAKAGVLKYLADCVSAQFE